MLKIEPHRAHLFNTASLHNRQTKKREELHKSNDDKLDRIQHVNKAHLKTKKDIQLIDSYDDLNRHIRYGHSAYSAYLGNNIDAFI
jgi:hypothetical protein